MRRTDDLEAGVPAVSLDELARRYRTRDQLLNDAQIGTWRFDPDLGLYYFADALSLGHEQLQAVPIATLQLVQHPDDQNKDIAIRERITTEGGAAEAEMRYRRHDGGWTHLRVAYRAGRKLPSGRYEMYGLSQDVTAVAEARDLARESTLRLRMALEAARAAVFEYDYRARTMWLSPEFEALTGRAPDTVHDVTDDSFYNYHPDDRAAVMALGRTKDQADPIDVRLMTLSGERWMRLYFEVERDAEGQRRRGVGLLLDIDDQKRQAIALEEARAAAEAATAAKSNFLASVSHEIRTPMNGVIGVLNLLKREALSEEGRKLLEEAIGCSDVLAQLINDVLDFSKMEAGKLDLSPHPTDPAAVVAGVLNLIRPQAEEKGIYLRSVIPEGMGHIEIDSLRLRQCLFNVIGNAVKFTSRGGVEVRLTLKDGRLRCEVADTGIGVPREAQDKLFSRFQQADTGTTRKFGGTGLGLAISRSLARMMGGDLDFESRDGEGSIFWLEIDAPPAQALAADPDLSIEATPLEGLSILVVDDNRTNRIVAVKSLEALGAAAEAVDSGQGAIDAVAAKAFDLVLMDINMPEMDGMEATRRIRALNAAAAALPIVAMTADVMVDQQARYYAAGMNGMVPKPFSPLQLLTEVARLASAADEPDLQATG